MNGQFCTIPTPFQPLANPPSCITALYDKNTGSILVRCSLQIKKTLDVSMPSQLAPNVWILTTAPSAPTTTITLICLGETTQFIEVRKPILVLCLPTACSATSPNFHLPPHYDIPPLEYISLDMANLNVINISSIHFQIWQHLEKHWNESQLQHLASIPSVPVGQLYKHMANGTKHITPFSPEESTADTDSIWTHVFTYRSLCNGNRITYTSRFGNILLLFLLVSTCQISVPNFTTRYHAIYN